MAIIKSKEDAITLYAEARELEGQHSSLNTLEEKGNVQKRVIELLTLAQNTCPHETVIRRKDLDAKGVETWECQDCFNLNYISIK